VLVEHQKKEKIMEASDLPEPIRRALEEASGLIVGLGAGPDPEEVMKLALKSVPEDLHTHARTIKKSSEVGREFADSMKNIMALILKPGMNATLITPLMLLTFDNMIERMVSLRAAITVEQDQPKLPAPPVKPEGE
jgi:hypothetical protein